MFTIGIINYTVAALPGFGIFGGGHTSSDSNYTDIYTYASNIVTAGTVLGLARSYPAATGNSSVGIFGGGVVTSTSNYTDIYTYASNVVTAGTVLGLST